MKKIIAAFVMIGLLAGCNDAPVQLISEKYRIVDIPENLYAQCPPLVKLPKSSSLTDAGVARLIVNLYNNDVQCHNALNNIRKYMTDAKVTVNGKSIY